MTHAEVDPFDAPEKPFKVGASEPHEVSSDLRNALLADASEEEEPEKEPNPSQKKADEEGAKVVDNYSARIQEKSEELYATEERLALKNEGYLQSLIDSEDPEDRKYAKKILKRNSEKFGASTIEDFKIKQRKAEVGDDPTLQKLAEVEVRTEELSRNQLESEWRSYKERNSVKGELEQHADSIRKEYPNMPYGEVITFAEGKLGKKTTTANKASASFAGGGQQPAETDDPFSSPLAKHLLPNAKETKAFAKSFKF